MKKVSKLAKFVAKKPEYLIEATSHYKNMGAKRTIFICITALLIVAALATFLGGLRAHSINAMAQEEIGIRVSLYFEKNYFVYTDEKLEPTNHLVAEEFYARKINGTYLQKREIMNRCVQAGSSYKTAVLYSMPKMQSVVDKAIQTTQKKPHDSEIVFKPSVKPMFRISKEKNGRYVDEDELYRDIYSALMIKPQARVDIRTRPIKPSITSDDNVDLTNLRSSYSTGFSQSGQNRKHNIGVGLKRVNGTVLEPDEVFSFNKRVGARSEKNGFKLSKIILNGRYEDGIGGGVCQVSTTVYNAALLSGMEIVSARAHSLECAYELPSFDCMVSSVCDLKFKNVTGGKVFIRAYVENDRAIVEFYGLKSEVVIKRKSEVVERKDPPKTEGFIDNEYKYHEQGAASGSEKFVTYPHGQLKSMGFLLYYNSEGHLIKRQKIRSDTYKEQKGLVAIAP